MEDFEFLSDVLSNYFFSSTMLAELGGNFKIKNHDSGDIILNGNDRWESLIIIKTGIIRFFYTLADGTETNKCFMKPGECIAPVWGECNELEISVAATSDATVIFINFHFIKSLLLPNNLLFQFENKLLRELLLKNIQREKSLITMNATSRYKYILDTMPDIAKNIPQFQLASYLGITPVSLSRIKRDIRKNNK